MSSTAVLLSPESMKSEARAVAMDVAAERQLYLAPEALPAVDDAVDERLPNIPNSARQPDKWKEHVRHVAEPVADQYLAEGVRRIVDSSDLLTRTRNAMRFYPYDYD